jgi:uncharacterized protein
MVEIGKLNTLKIVKEVDFGLYLDGGLNGEILIPKRYVPENWEIDGEIEVFIYNDSEDRIIATTDMPYAMVGDFAYLEVISVNTVGAFLDWGLAKDLLVPFREQNTKMREGKSYVVAIYLDDESQRIVATSKLDKVLDNIPVEYEENQEIEILIQSRTDLGYKVIINKSHWGMIYENQIFQEIEIGQQMKAYIQKIREDEKIDVMLHKPGFEKVDILANLILSELKENHGFLSVNDKSSSEDIYELFKESKKTFKKALGQLYRKKLIVMDESGIKLNKK